MSTNVCSRLDASVDKNLVRGKKSLKKMREGSLSERASGYFWMSASWKLAAGERILSLPFMALRGASGKLLK